MMSSAATSSPVSASTLAYLMRWPVLRLIWLKLTFSLSDVAGYRATGQVTSERRKKPFQLARGAMKHSEKRDTPKRNRRQARITREPGIERIARGIFRKNLPTALTVAGRDGSEPGCGFWPILPAFTRPKGPEHHSRPCVAFDSRCPGNSGIPRTTE